MFLRNCGFRLLEIGKQTKAPFVEARTTLGQRQTPCRATQQLDAEAGLQCRYATAHDRFGDIQTIGSRGEAARFHNGDKRCHIVKPIHIVANYRTIISIKGCLLPL